MFTINWNRIAPVPRPPSPSFPALSLMFICSIAGQWLCKCPHRCSWSSRGQRKWRQTRGRDLCWQAWSLVRHGRSLLTPVQCPYGKKLQEENKSHSMPNNGNGFTEMCDWFSEITTGSSILQCSHNFYRGEVSWRRVNVLIRHLRTSDNRVN